MVRRGLLSRNAKRKSKTSARKGCCGVHDKIGGNRTRSVSEGFCAYTL
jgi:hypothetical protein